MNILCIVGIMVSIIIFTVCICMATSSPSPLGGEIAGMVLSAILFFVCFLLLIYNLGKTKETMIRIDDNQFVEKTESGSEICNHRWVEVDHFPDDRYTIYCPVCGEEKELYGEEWKKVQMDMEY